MGYQEYVYKIEKPIKFMKYKEELDKFIFDVLIDQVDYSLVEFKEKIGEIVPGYYLYIGGDRQFGKGLIGSLNKGLGNSKYYADIESAIGCYRPGNNENSKKLTKLFKNKTTETGRVICKYEGDKQNEKNQREF